MSRLLDSWPVIVQAAGVALVAVGFGLLAVWAGFAIGGLGLTLMGIAGELSRPPRPH